MTATETAAPKPSPRRRLSPELRREEVLAAAAEQFDRHAYDQLTAEKLAEGCGVSVGLLYHYFGNKRDLYVACLERAIAELVAAVEDPGSGLSPDERLPHIMDTYLDWVAEHPRRYLAVLRGGIGMDDEVHARVQVARERFVRFIAEGLGVQEPGPALVLAIWGFMGFVEATCARWLQDPQVGREDARGLLLETGLATFARALAR